MKPLAFLVAFGLMGMTVLVFVNQLGLRRRLNTLVQGQREQASIAQQPKSSPATGEFKEAVAEFASARSQLVAAEQRVNNLTTRIE